MSRIISRYGLDNFTVLVSLGAICIANGAIIYPSLLSYILYFIGLLLIFLALWFFRDPDRQVPNEAMNDDSLVLSPADGKVIEIVTENENIFLKSEAIRISIFLSVLDVHVNRSPVTGIVRYLDYVKGKFLIASAKGASVKNQQSQIGVETGFGKVFFKQLVGILARRLVFELKENQSLIAGERFGMMKFGSRMDIFLNPNSELYIKVGDKVKGGVTIMAKLKET
jgi:phosphatidylserine decarboxylase